MAIYKVTIFERYSNGNTAVSQATVEADNLITCDPTATITDEIKAQDRMLCKALGIGCAPFGSADTSAEIRIKVDHLTN